MSDAPTDPPPPAGESPPEPTPDDDPPRDAWYPPQSTEPPDWLASSPLLTLSIMTMLSLGSGAIVEAGGPFGLFLFAVCLIAEIFLASKLTDAIGGMNAAAACAAAFVMSGFSCVSQMTFK
jgi:hypothetical protein